MLNHGQRSIRGAAFGKRFDDGETVRWSRATWTHPTSMYVCLYECIMELGSSCVFLSKANMPQSKGTCTQSPTTRSLADASCVITKTGFKFCLRCYFGVQNEGFTPQYLKNIKALTHNPFEHDVASNSSTPPVTPEPKRHRRSPSPLRTSSPDSEEAL